MNNKLIGLSLGAILALGGGPLGAQGLKSRLSVAASVGYATDSLNAITATDTNWWNPGGSWNIDFGYSGTIANSGVPFRLSLGYNYMPAGKVQRDYITWKDGGYNWDDPNGIADGASQWYFKRSLDSFALAGDIFVDAKVVPNLSLIVGISLNKYTIHDKLFLADVSDTNLPGGIGSYPRAGKFLESYSYSDGGIKFGGRFGIDYKISDSLSFDVIMQFTELGHEDSAFKFDPERPDHTIEEARYAWNPSWLQFGIKYTF